MSRFLLSSLALGLAILPIHPAAAQDSAHPDLRLSVVGVGAKDYNESLNFYTKIMGLRLGIFVRNRGEDHECVPAAQPRYVPRTANVHCDESPPGSRISTCKPPTWTPSRRVCVKPVLLLAAIRETDCVGDPRAAQPTNEKNVLIVDPSGIRIEPTQLTPGSLTRKAVDSWTGNASERLLVVGIAVTDYPASENFYEKTIGFPVAFKFTSPDSLRTTKYYQISRDSFLEMQPVTATTPAGITHVHILTEDLAALIAKLKQAGLAAAPRNGHHAKYGDRAWTHAAQQCQKRQCFRSERHSPGTERMAAGFPHKEGDGILEIAGRAAPRQIRIEQGV